jgi:hypothetical protein
MIFFIADCGSRFVLSQLASLPIATLWQFDSQFVALLTGEVKFELRVRFLAKRKNRAEAQNS